MKIQKKSLAIILKKIESLEKKAELFAIWEDDLEYFSAPCIMGYTSKGMRLMNRAESFYGRIQGI